MFQIEKDPKLFEYDLICFDEQIIPSLRKPIRTVMMSELEADHRNKGFSLNQTNKRYIKKDSCNNKTV